MKPLHTFYFLVGTTLLSYCFLACNKREIQAPQDYTYQYNYVPQILGKYIDYQADSIVYSFVQGEGFKKTAFTTYLRNILADTVRGSNDELLYKTEQYQRSSDTLPWVLTKVFTTRLDQNEFTRTEENIRYIPLIFPMNKRSDWDGLRYIDANRELEIREQRLRPFTNWGFEVDSIDVASQMGSFALDSVLVVTEADDVNAIEKRFSRVKYAIGIGMVYREQWILDSQYCNTVTPPADCETKPWEDKGERGYILKQWMIGHN